MDLTIIAHRGAKGMAPENTLAAAHLAHRQGADMWELDAGLSRDNVPMVLHDEGLLRTTDVSVLPAFVHRHPWLLDQLSLAELRGLDAGSWFGPEFKGEALPTLEEALKEVYSRARTVHFKDVYYRHDIGHRELARRK